MQISIISASQRIESQAAKIANVIQNKLENTNFENGLEVYNLDLAVERLPVFSENNFNPKSKAILQWQKLKINLKNSDALVILVPEYGGMPTPNIINFLLYLGSTLADRPVMLVGVSSGRGGRYPLASLRSVAQKNTRLVFIPDQLLIEHVSQVFNNSNSQKMSPEDQLNQDYLDQRIDYSLQNLLTYAKHFQSIRKNLKLDLKKYPFGM